MPRRRRLLLADVPQHLIQRGNNRQVTFFNDDDFRFYRDRTADAARKYECRIYAYVLMRNHVHLLASSALPEGLSLMMQHVGRCFVRYINRRYRRSGTLWEGRFKSSMVETETYFLRCCRYIECNPVRAGLARSPAEYRWSSYGYHAFGRADAMLSPHETYLGLGLSHQEREASYRALVQSELDDVSLAEISEAVEKGWPVGSERFREQIEEVLQCAVGPLRRGRPLKSASEKLL